MRLTSILCLAIAAGCAHRTVAVVTDPPGALVSTYPDRKVTTISPGPLTGLRTLRSYTVRAALPGHVTTYAVVPQDSSFPWPPPINLAIEYFGGYDSTLEIKLPPCPSEGTCQDVGYVRPIE